MPCHVSDALAKNVGEWTVGGHALLCGTDKYFYVKYTHEEDIKVRDEQALCRPTTRLG